VILSSADLTDLLKKLEPDLILYVVMEPPG
jgi:hypothetical protein